VNLPLLQMDFTGCSIADKPDYREKLFSMFRSLQVLDNKDRFGREFDYDNGFQDNTNNNINRGTAKLNSSIIQNAQNDFMNFSMANKTVGLSDSIADKSNSSIVNDVSFSFRVNNSVKTKEDSLSNFVREEKSRADRVVTHEKVLKKGKSRIDDKAAALEQQVAKLSEENQKINDWNKNLYSQLKAKIVACQSLKSGEVTPTKSMRSEAKSTRFEDYPTGTLAEQLAQLKSDNDTLRYQLKSNEQIISTFNRKQQEYEAAVGDKEFQVRIMLILLTFFGVVENFWLSVTLTVFLLLLEFLLNKVCYCIILNICIGFLY